MHDFSLRAVAFAVAVLAGLNGHAARANGAQSAKEQTAASDTFDRATLVIMAPEGPVLADLRISVAKLPYRQWVGQFLAKQLDQDKSGTLDSAELDLLTEKIKAAVGNPDSARIISEVNPQPSAASVSAVEFSRWIRNRLPQNFAISAGTASADDAVRLSTLIDVNQDSAISQEELQNAIYTLRFRDLDDDQTFSISELMPYRDPLSQSAVVSPDVASLPFMEVTDSASAARAAARVMSRYGMDGRLKKSILRLPQSASESEPFTTPQLSGWLEQPDFHVTIEVKLSDLSNRSDVVISEMTHSGEFCRIKKDGFGSTLLRVDGMPIQVVARGGGAGNRSYLRGFIGQNFLMADADKNQYLDEMELNTMMSALSQAGVAASFQAFDRNSDKMVTREELFGFVDRDQIASASQIEVTVEQDGKTLFGLLDRNQDRRLSARELSSGYSQLQPFDLTSDGKFSDDELGIEYKLVVGLGRAEIRRNNSGNMAAMQMRQPGAQDAILPDAGSLNGPEWFQRMDRNQDGDVSQREFIGTVGMFAEMDQDGDGLISSDEAAAAQSNVAAE